MIGGFVIGVLCVFWFLFDRAEGNPFFAEEIFYNLHQNGFITFRAMQDKMRCLVGDDFVRDCIPGLALVGYDSAGVLSDDAVVESYLERARCDCCDGRSIGFHFLAGSFSCTGGVAARVVSE